MITFDKANYVQFTMMLDSGPATTDIQGFLRLFMWRGMNLGTFMYKLKGASRSNVGMLSPEAGLCTKARAVLLVHREEVYSKEK